MKTLSGVGPSFLKTNTRKLKKAEAGLLGFLQLKIFQRLKRSLDVTQSKVTAHVQMVAI
jgi:hypothetical protein